MFACLTDFAHRVRLYTRKAVQVTRLAIQDKIERTLPRILNVYFVGYSRNGEMSPFAAKALREIKEKLANNGVRTEYTVVTVPENESHCLSHDRTPESRNNTTYQLEIGYFRRMRYAETIPGDEWLEYYLKLDGRECAIGDFAFWAGDAYYGTEFPGRFLEEIRPYLEEHGYIKGFRLLPWRKLTELVPSLPTKNEMTPL